MRIWIFPFYNLLTIRILGILSKTMDAWRTWPQTCAPWSLRRLWTALSPLSAAWCPCLRRCPRTFCYSTWTKRLCDPKTTFVAHQVALKIVLTLSSFHNFNYNSKSHIILLPPLRPFRSPHLLGWPSFPGGWSAPSRRAPSLSRESLVPTRVRFCCSQTSHNCGLEPAPEKYRYVKKG